jgi:hypothetical protein
MRDLAPEFALGLADGEERAEALRHLSACGDCRRLVERLSEVADELLTLAPVREPPAGFESRVVERLAPAGAPRPRRARRILSRLAPALAAAAVTAAALVAAYHDDHELATSYRQTLERAGGRYFQAQRLHDPAGHRAGLAFGYQGSPSWVVVVVDRAHRDEVGRGELMTTDGHSSPLSSFRLDPRTGTWGGAIPVDLHRVRSIRLLGKRPGQVIGAPLSHEGDKEP